MVMCCLKNEMLKKILCFYFLFQGCDIYPKKISQKTLTAQYPTCCLTLLVLNLICLLGQKMIPSRASTLLLL